MRLYFHPILIVLFILVYFALEGPDPLEGLSSPDFWDEFKTEAQSKKEAPEPPKKKEPPKRAETPAHPPAKVKYAGNFTAAKRKAMRIYEDHRSTFYCGCAFDEEKQIDPTGCGYEPRKNAKRGARVEWEHVMPAARLGKSLRCWDDGGRKHCRKISAEFRHRENDLHNLVPAVGELNGDRLHYDYGIVLGEPRRYGACDFEVDSSFKVAEVASSLRGDVARIYFYMAYTYGIPLSASEIDQYTRWATEDPVDAWEVTRDQRIAEVQGNHNPYVSLAAPDGAQGRTRKAR